MARLLLKLFQEVAVCASKIDQTQSNNRSKHKSENSRNAKLIILNAQLVILNENLIICNTNFIIVNAKFIIFAPFWKLPPFPACSSRPLQNLSF